MSETLLGYSGMFALNKTAGGVPDAVSDMLNKIPPVLLRDPLFGDAGITDMWNEGGNLIWARLEFNPQMGNRRDVDPVKDFNPGKNTKKMFAVAEATLAKVLGTQIQVKERITPSQNWTPPKPRSAGPGLGKIPPTKAEWFDFYTSHPYILEFTFFVPEFQKRADDEGTRREMTRLATEHPELRKHLVPLLKQALEVPAAKLLKPSPYTIPLPWPEVQAQLGVNINAFTARGCTLTKVRPVNDPYALFMFRGTPFTVSVERRMPNVIGNLWVEAEDAIAVASKLSRLVNIASALKVGADKGNGTVLQDKLKPIGVLFTSKWARLLAIGIVESMLELKGVAIVGELAPEPEEVQQIVHPENLIKVP